mmetsp:Transcript_31660/g.51099  ORF Transcript_31660/g.51099 Transcript_31660/m.51099 type:complete len:86 (-) Transcript_31660:130-387(-)
MRVYQSTKTIAVVHLFGEDGKGRKTIVLQRRTGPTLTLCSLHHTTPHDREQKGRDYDFRTPVPCRFFSSHLLIGGDVSITSHHSP